jgi:transcriptional regulator GlxA family with amidase domain
MTSTTGRRGDHSGALVQQGLLVSVADRERGVLECHLAEVIAWAQANLDRQLSLDELAARALMSRRSFVRHFKAATGATPHAWLLSQRLSRAEELLETTTLPIEQIAGRVGYRSAAVFREQFTARRGVPPRARKPGASGALISLRSGHGSAHRDHR